MRPDGLDTMFDVSCPLIDDRGRPCRSVLRVAFPHQGFDWSVFRIEAVGRDHAHRLIDIDGVVSWRVWGGSVVPIAWHAHDPCVHGFADIDEDLIAAMPEDTSDPNADVVAGLQQLAETIVGLVVPLTETTHAPPLTAAPEEPVSAAPGFVELLRLAGVERGPERVAPRWHVWELDVVALLEGLTKARWDVAVCLDELRVVLIADPAGRRVRPAAVSAPGTRPTGSIASFLYLWEPLGDTADEMQLFDVRECQGGATATFRVDIAPWHVTSPVTSAPAVGWFSVIGSDVVYVGLINDSDVAYSRSVRLPTAAEAPLSERDWILVARSMFGA